jgi:hypothetical protein
MNRIIIGAVVVVLGLFVHLAGAAKVENMQAFNRAGQTFVTWTENGAQEYRLYRSPQPITRVAGFRPVATMPSGTGNFASELARKDAKTGKVPMETITGAAGYGLRYVIKDNPAADPSAMLPEGTGLYVYTPHEADKFYYAITAVHDGQEDVSNFASIGPIEEKPGQLGAVLMYQKDQFDKNGAKVATLRLYTHWMDAASWNPEPTGGAAFTFGLAIPVKPRGLAVQLHGYSGTYDLHEPLADMVTLIPADPYQSWWYGYRDPGGKQVVNYTQQRIVATIGFVLRQMAAEGVHVDANKIYTHGGSMGGTGGNELGAWNGDLFAAVLASKGAVDHNRNGKWTADSVRLWGKPSDNLPTNQGDKVWDHMNLIAWHLAHPEVETAFFLDAHASNDESVVFDAVPEYYEALQKARRPFAATWGPWGHGGFAEPRWPNHKWWGTFQFNRDESVPAIGYATSNDKPVAGGTGQINCKIEWCSRENDFDPSTTRDNAVDKPDRWEMQFRSPSGPQTAMITPRRYQLFKPKAGDKFHWENWSYADPAKPVKVAEGDIAADQYGLVSVERFAIDKPGWGNRLVIYKQ